MDMSLTLVHPDVVRKWDKAIASGSDKRYPSLDLVRLEHWFFEHKPGLLLDYGCGSGVNTIHLLECGHRVDGIDASIEAVKVVERKLAKRPDIRDRLTLKHLPVDAEQVPYPDGVFDYVVCVSVLSLLASRERVKRLLAEFSRMMKPGAKIIADINAPEADFARGMKHLGNDVYLYEGGGEGAVPTYCPTEKRFHELVNEYFNIDDVGFTAFKYMHSAITEYIVCAHKA